MKKNAFQESHVAGTEIVHCVHTYIQSKIGHKITVKFDTNCDVKNIAYVIICKGCHVEYVLKTNDLQKRMSVYRNHIRDPSNRILRISGHIDNCNDTEPNLNVFPL